MKTKGEATKERIVDEAARVISRKGVAATSVSDFLDAAKVKKGSLYFHFEGKDALALSALEKARREFSEFLDDALSGGSPGERLEGFFCRVLDKHRKDGFAGGCIFGNTAIEANVIGAGYSKLVDAVFDEWAERLRIVIGEAREAGQVRSDMDPGALARHVVSSIEGGIMLSKVRRRGGPLKECLDTLRKLLGLGPEKNRRR